MSAIVFETNLTESEKASIRERSRSGCKLSDKGHLVVDGIEKNAYANVRVYLRGTSYQVNRHRLCYFIDKDFAPLPPGHHVSHLCHVKNCCQEDHLTIEPPQINNSRKLCFKSKLCQGHEGFLNCVILLLTI